VMMVEIARNTRHLANRPMQANTFAARRVVSGRRVRESYRK